MCIVAPDLLGLGCLSLGLNLGGCLFNLGRCLLLLGLGRRWAMNMNDEVAPADALEELWALWAKPTESGKQAAVAELARAFGYWEQ